MSSLENCLFRSSTHFFFFDWVVYLFIFFFLILSSMSCLYNLESKPLLVASFGNIFSHSVGCLFILLVVSFAV